VYRITEADINLMVEKVQDRTSKAFEEAKHQRGQIQDDLDGIKPHNEYTIHTIAQASPIFRVTNDMLHMDETTT
jgi:hypothetical protein